MDYFKYKFPNPQYLGSKYIHKEWIKGLIPEDCSRVLDAFAGSQSISYMLKQMGKSVITNDFMKFSSIIGKALVENNNETLTNEDCDILFSSNNDPQYYNLIESLYNGLFFNIEDCKFADSLRSNVHKLDGEYKQSLALCIMCRSMTRKVTMGHFAHTKALEYAANAERIKRNRSLILPLKDIFVSLVKEYNDAVFDNGKKNISYNLDAIELITSLNNIDVAYFDPPYCNSHADYQSFYHLLETYVEYWKDKQFVNSIKRYEPKRYSGFDKKRDAIDSFKKLFEVSKNIPIWIISYNDRSYPNIDKLRELISPYKKVNTFYKRYVNCHGGKGSVAGSNEVALVCY